MLVSAASSPQRRHGRSRIWLFAALPLLLLAVACGSDEEPDDDDAAVATGGGGLSTETATMTPTATPTTRTAAPSVEDLEVAAWGEQVCGIADDFAIGFLASGDPRNPAELTLDERKGRAETMFPVQLDAVAQAIARLDDAEPPERTSQLHLLLRSTYIDLQQALEVQREEIRNAATGDEITASNLAVNQLIDLALRQSALLVNAGYC